MAKSIISLLIAALSLSGCAAGPDYKRPGVDAPAAWNVGAIDSVRSSSAGDKWWSIYGDPVLDQMEQDALSNNNDIKIAAARMWEAKALAGVTDAGRFPGVTAGFSSSRNKVTEAGATPLPSNWPRTQDNFRGTVNVSYELDFWGKYSRASEAARAELLASEYSRDSVYLSVTARVAEFYFALLAADAQEAIMRKTLASRREVLEAFKKYRKAGVYSDYDLRQAEAEEAGTRSQLAAAINGKERAEGALSVLLGRSPHEIMTEQVKRGTPGLDMTLVVPDGLPSELMLRRPDIREAEQKLIAANARIGAARAMFFPSVGLTAALGGESASLSSLFGGAAGIFSFMAAATQPIWDAGRIKGGVEIAEARNQQALAQYQNTVANAFLDVRNALSAQSSARETVIAEGDRIKALTQAVKQAQLRFDAGMNTRLEVLDAERSLLQAELNNIDARRAHRAAVVGLFKALGGGWERSDARPEGLASN